jgi:hypothetical protein
LELGLNAREQKLIGVMSRVIGKKDNVDVTL